MTTNVFNPTITIKIRKDAREKLRMIYALTGKSQLAILDEIVSAELERIQRGRTKEPITDEERLNLSGSREQVA